MIPQSLKIYIISLPEDQHRRNGMRAQFGSIYDEFEIIDGIRLPDKKALIKLYGQRTYDPALTVSELGCALSHVTALEHFLHSEATYALILEDDAIGNEASIIDIANTMYKLPHDAFLLCGGQEGLRGQPYNYGKPTNIKDVFQIPEIAKKFYTRACCYCVTKTSAAHILAIQKERLGLSDSWDKYFKGWRNFFFTKKILHPTCLVDSNIEAERAISKPAGELARIRKDGVKKVVNRFLSKIILRKLSWLSGFIQIK